MSERRTRSPWRRLAGGLVLIGAILLGAHFLDLGRRLATVEIRYQLGDPPRAQALRAVVRRAGDGEQVAILDTRLVGPVVTHRPRLRPGSYQVDLELDTPAGKVTARRALEVEGDATVTIDLRE